MKMCVSVKHAYHILFHIFFHILFQIMAAYIFHRLFHVFPYSCSCTFPYTICLGISYWILWRCCSNMMTLLFFWFVLCSPTSIFVYCLWWHCCRPNSFKLSIASRSLLLITQYVMLVVVLFFFLCAVFAFVCVSCYSPSFFSVLLHCINVSFFFSVDIL